MGLGAAETESPTGTFPTAISSGGAGIWEAGVGEGFLRTARSFSLEAGGGIGVRAFGGKQRHYLALASLSYGHVLDPVLGEDRWWRGNVECRLELFSGAQFSPGSEGLVGLAPHLRYDFATGTRWVPFIDAGAGVTATSIGTPDLSNIFEFNLQGGAGLHLFLREDLALTIEARYLHLSCAGISRPNNGLNTVMGMVGLTWFF